jgi:hypothetical protein
MSVIDINKIKEELTIFLRNSDIFTTTQRGVTTVTEEFDGTGAQTNFVLTNTIVRNVRTVAVGGTSLTPYVDYTVNYDNATVSFTVPPASGTDNVDITYDYGSTDKIYPDFPKPSLSISSFPRIAVDLIGVSSDPGGFGNVNVSNISFTVVVYDPKLGNVSNYLTDIRTAFINAQTSFYNLSNYVRPLSIGPVIKSPRDAGKDKIFQQNIDFMSALKYEVN